MVEISRARMLEVSVTADRPPRCEWQVIFNEREATPNYYGDAHYLAWFKLDRIEDAELAVTELQA